MTAHPERRIRSAGSPAWGDAAQAMYRAAQAVSQPSGPGLFGELVRELAETLRAAVVFIAVFTDASRTTLRTLAAQLDGHPLNSFDYPLEGSPCALVVGRSFRYVARGVSAEFPPGTIFGVKGMDAYAAYPLNDSQGSPLGLLVSMDRQPIADATLAEALLKIFAARIAAEIEQQRAHEALLRSEASYRAIFESAEDAIFIHDWDSGEVLDVNPKACETFGYSQAELRGISVAVISSGLVPYTGEQAWQYLQLAKLGRCPVFEWHRRNKDGSLHWDEVRLKPVEISGRPHILAYTREITERKAALSALQRSEARLRATVEAAFDCVIGMDGEGRIVEFNAAAERCFGHSRDEVLGRLLADTVLPERHREAHTRGLQHFHRSGRGPMVGRLVETTALRADGSEFPVEMAISVAAVPEGSIFVGHLRDISARRVAEAERTALEAQLRQAQKMEAIGQLSGGMAHDFNNILTSVVGYLVLGQERAATLADATLMRQLGQAQLAAQRASDLIARLLAFARRQRGERRVLPLAPLVWRSMQLLRSTLPASVLLDGIETEADPEADTPPVLADAVQIEQVLFNLCINARDAMNGAGQIRVNLRETVGSSWRCASCGCAVGSPHGGAAWVELSVSDSGSGIAPEVTARMFEPFYTTKEVGRGSGMGLAMVHGIVHEHGGHVLVDTQPGRGTRFRILLPPTATAAEAGAVAGPVQLPPAARLHGRVLVVEDEAMVGDFMAEMLSGWGLQVVLMRDPHAALAWLEDGAHALDALITDQTMPQLTGLALARHARALRPGLPLLLYTGNADAIDAAELARHGVHTLLRKPVDPVVLREWLQRVLGL
jgi:PAS domain S-box-containing protein